MKRIGAHEKHYRILAGARPGRVYDPRGKVGGGMVREKGRQVTSRMRKINILKTSGNSPKKNDDI